MTTRVAITRPLYYRFSSSRHDASAVDDCCVFNVLHSTALPADEELLLELMLLEQSPRFVASLLFANRKERDNTITIAQMLL